MERCVETVNGFQQVTTFAKCSILNVLQGKEYAPALLHFMKHCKLAN